MLQRPFVNYYAPIFILWELSTPFLNVHWFCDKLGLTGTKLQLYNGFALLFTFFSARLVYGTYQSYQVFTDIHAALGSHPTLPDLAAAAANGTEPLTDVLRFATATTTVPAWLGVAYLASNCVLNFLNFYWFFKMVSAVRRRFTPAADAAPEKLDRPQLVAAAGAHAVSSARISDEGSPTAAAKPRRRKA